MDSTKSGTTNWPITSIADGIKTGELIVVMAGRRGGKSQMQEQMTVIKNRNPNATSVWKIKNFEENKYHKTLGDTTHRILDSMEIGQLSVKRNFFITGSERGIDAAIWCKEHRAKQIGDTLFFERVEDSVAFKILYPDAVKFDE